MSGFIVTRPRAYAVWERLQGFLDAKFKDTGVQNAYFPSSPSRTSNGRRTSSRDRPRGRVGDRGGQQRTRRATRGPAHLRVDHHHHPYISQWVRSHRDLPLRVNQWCSVVRWEATETKPFFRTKEFLWQEGATPPTLPTRAPGKNDDAARPVRVRLRGPAGDARVEGGQKPDHDKFPGAETTTTVEALMPDGSVQAGHLPPPRTVVRGRRSTSRSPTRTRKSGSRTPPRGGGVARTRRAHHDSLRRAGARAPARRRPRAGRRRPHLAGRTRKTKCSSTPRASPTTSTTRGSASSSTTATGATPDSSSTNTSSTAFPSGSRSAPTRSRTASSPSSTGPTARASSRTERASLRCDRPRPLRRGVREAVRDRRGDPRRRGSRGRRPCRHPRHARPARLRDGLRGAATRRARSRSKPMAAEIVMVPFEDDDPLAEADHGETCAICDDDAERTAYFAKSY